MTKQRPIEALADLVGVSTRTILRDITQYNKQHGTGHAATIDADVPPLVRQWICDKRNAPEHAVIPIPTRQDNGKVIAVIPDTNEVNTKKAVADFSKAQDEPNKAFDITTKITPDEYEQRLRAHREQLAKERAEAEKEQKTSPRPGKVANTAKKSIDPVRLLFDHPVSVSISVLILLIYQAFIFATLAGRHLSLHPAALIAGAFLFEGVGISMSLMRVRDDIGDYDKSQILSRKMWWVYGFAVIQFVVDLLYVEVYNATTWAAVVALVLISAAIPGAIAAISFKYNYQNGHHDN
jgi:hypothetical protein